MSLSRLSFAALAVAAVTLIPSAGVIAADDLTDTVREIAAETADLVRQELQLVKIAQTGDDLPDRDLTALRAELRTIDDQGAEALDQLDQLDIELTDAIRVVLDRLPQASAPRPGLVDLRPPPPVVYEAAITDLLRISDDPEAVTPIDDGRGPGGALLLVATLGLVVLGAFALGSTIRRRPANDDLAAMVWSDSLTGLANRRRLDHDLSSGVSRSGSSAVIMVDVDHFKSVNDSFGHQQGDEVLRSIATMLANQIRFDDVVYRYGGEEFCVLLPDSSTDEARQVADRIVRAAREIPLPDGQHVTVSVGVACSTAGDIGTAMASADDALYRAKDLGRDQAVTADEPEFVDA
jgi:diguanylate cyclase (GGDEF)-like protein